MNREIGKIAEISVGYQPRQGIEPSEAGSWRIIQMKDIDDRRQVQWQNLTRFEPDRPANIELIRLQPGDVLFVARGHKNWATAVNPPGSDIIAAYYFFILRVVVDRITPEYLAWYINQKPAQEFLTSMARRGSHMPVIPKSAFEVLPVEIPPLETQQLVVKIDQLHNRERELQGEISSLREKLLAALLNSAIYEHENKR